MTWESASRGGAVAPLHCILLGVLAAWIWTGCSSPENCEPGFAEGEQFRITVLSEERWTDHCGVVPLAPGDSFVLTGGQTYEKENGCTNRSALPEVPEFAADILSECRTRSVQLGMFCEGYWPEQECSIRMALSVGPYIAPSAQVIEDGGLTVGWTGDTCYPVGCDDLYNVRIERLGMAE